MRLTVPQASFGRRCHYPVRACLGRNLLRPPAAVVKTLAQVASANQRWLTFTLLHIDSQLRYLGPLDPLEARFSL